jgi:hypothetical protein
MSYRNPGNIVSPPTTPTVAATRAGKRATNAIVVVGVILLALFAISYFALLRAKQIMETPINPVAREVALKDVPKFPYASYDKMATQSLLLTERIFMRQYSAKSVDALGFSSVISPGQIIAWYDRNMPLAGYQSDASSDLSKGFREAQARRYRKGNQMVLIQVQNRTQQERDTLILVYRFKDVSE